MNSIDKQLKNKTMKLKNVFQIIALVMMVFMASCKKEDVGGVRPVVTSTDPVNKATGIGLSSKISAIFSVAMNASSITTATFTVHQGTAVVTGTVTYIGTTATFTPAANLAASTVYTATVTTGARNAAGTSLANDYVWTFTSGTAPDVTPPTVTVTDPTNSATGVAMNHAIVATFSEPMDQTTLNSLTFTLKQGSAPVAGVVTFTSTTVTFTPTSNLTASTVYTMTITTGAKDIAGNSMAANYVASFTTAAAPDTTLPTVISTDPGNLAINIKLNKVISVTFSEAMDPLTINATTLTLKQGTTPISGSVTYSGTTANFTPSNNFTPSLTYTATITTGAKDVAGNPLAASTVWSFAAGSSTTSISPVDLGAAGNYLILAKSEITNISTSALTGDLGLSPAATSYITGLALTNATGYATSAQVTGKIYAADMASPTPINLTTAVNNMITAYNDAAGRPTPDFSELGTGNIGGKTLTPGLYKWTNTVTLPSDVTISGGANDVWIFQISGDLTMSNAVNVTLIGGAQAKNIFWQVAGTVTLGTTSHFAGIVLSKTGITFKTGASFTGRALAQTAVILDGNALTKP